MIEQFVEMIQYTTRNPLTSAAVICTLACAYKYFAEANLAVVTTKDRLDDTGESGTHERPRGPVCGQDSPEGGCVCQCASPSVHRGGTCVGRRRQSPTSGLTDVRLVLVRTRAWPLAGRPQRFVYPQGRLVYAPRPL
jgi:hypothetical protein